MNPTNQILFHYAVPGCGESRGEWIMEFDIKKESEDKVFLMAPRCQPEKITVRVSKKFGYGASYDNLRGKYHFFEVKLTDKTGKEMGNVTYQPEWGRCLVMGDQYCSQSGTFNFGPVSFSFQMSKK